MPDKHVHNDDSSSKTSDENEVGIKATSVLHQ